MKRLFKITFTLIFTTILLLGFALPLNPAGNWYQQFMPSIGGRTILDITFLDSLTGYSITSISSDTSYVLKTTNGGDSWIINYRAPSSIFRRIQFVNNNTGFIGGQNLFKTTNSGVNWSIIYPSLFSEDMYFINSDTAWYADPNSLVGGVFRTTNGGASWDQQYSAGSQNPEKIYMFNARIGFISDNSGLPSIRKTTNGGMNWDLNVSGQWYADIEYSDSLTGWYTAASNIYKTTNCGLNWILQYVPTGPDLLNLGIYKLSILNGDTLWAAGNAVFFPNSQVRGILLRTTNGGNNWQYQVPDTAINNFLYYHLQFVNKNNGWAYTTQKGIHTTTGGDPIWFTGITQISSQIPKEFKLYQNYPNPFNPKTNIKYQLTKNNSYVKLIIFDITGKEIIKLVDKEQNSGTYEVDFAGIGYSSGVYFYRLSIEGQIIDTKKMMLVK